MDGFDGETVNSVSVEDGKGLLMSKAVMEQGCVGKTETEKQHSSTVMTLDVDIVNIKHHTVVIIQYIYTWTILRLYRMTFDPGRFMSCMI